MSLLSRARPATSAELRSLATATLFEMATDCIAVLDRDGILLDVNDAGLALFAARSRDALLGTRPEALVPDLDRARFRAAYASAFTGTTSAIEHEVVTSATRRRHVETRVTPMHDAAGAVVAALVVARDVTERHAAAARLRDSELRFRRLADSAPLGIFVGDAEGRVLYANPKYQAIWQLPGEHALGTGWQTRVHPDDAKSLEASGVAAFAAGQEFISEYRIVLPDGRVRWVRGHMVMQRDASGTATGSLGTVEDVTALHEAADAEATARALAELEHARLEAVLEALPAGVVIVDASGRIIRMTQPARALWGGDLHAESVDDYGRYTSRLLGSGEVVPPEERALARALRGETTPPREYVLDRLDGGTSTVLGAGAPVRDAEGRITGAVVAITDLSERMRLETQLRQAQKMEAVGQLAGGVAHDFNNLLTVINGNLEFARQGLEPAHPAQHDLAQVAQAAERARSLVRQLLAFSRKQVVQSQDVDLNDVVRGADVLLRRVLGDEIVFEALLAPTPTVVRADRGQLEQVLMNLVLNARDAMLDDAHGRAGTGGTLTITIDAMTLDDVEAARYAPTRPGRYVRLMVADTGHGMDEATRAHIFEPFFTTKPVGAGTGLGLATVYGIVTQAGGSVHVASAPGEGATFTILLPNVTPTATTRDGPRTSLPPRGHGTVLLVEDEAAVRLTTRRVLERHGYSVLEARHGVDALAVWREYDGEVVCCVTDLRMPEMGGRELVARLRADRPDLAAVYVSGYNDPSAARPDDDARDAFVEKPFTAEALLTAVAAVSRSA